MTPVHPTLPSSTTRSTTDNEVLVRGSRGRRCPTPVSGQVTSGEDNHTIPVVDSRLRNIGKITGSDRTKKREILASHKIIQDAGLGSIEVNMHD
jgi:hypothetical protein